MNLNNFTTIQKLIGLVIAIGIFLLFIFRGGLYSAPAREKSEIKQETKSEIVKSEHPVVVSTLPANLRDDQIIPSAQKIEITFSDPIENRGEVKSTIVPEIDYEIQLSSDKKTVKFLPKKPLELGRSFSFTIKSDTKFDGGKRLDHDEEFKFSTIAYHGV